MHWKTLITVSALLFLPFAAAMPASASGLPAGAGVDNGDDGVCVTAYEIEHPRSGYRVCVNAKDPECVVMDERTTISGTERRCYAMTSGSTITSAPGVERTCVGPTGGYASWVACVDPLGECAVFYGAYPKGAAPAEFCVSNPTASVGTAADEGIDMGYERCSGWFGGPALRLQYCVSAEDDCKVTMKEYREKVSYREYCLVHD